MFQYKLKQRREAVVIGDDGDHLATLFDDSSGWNSSVLLFSFDARVSFYIHFRHSQHPNLCWWRWEKRRGRSPSAVYFTNLSLPDGEKARMSDDSTLNWFVLSCWLRFRTRENEKWEDNMMNCCSDKWRHATNILSGGEVNNRCWLTKRMSRLVIILSTRASEQEKYVRANNSGRAVRAWSIPHEYEYFSCHLLLFISDHLVFLDRKMINPVMPIAASEHSSNVLCQPFFHLQCPSHPVDCNSSFAPLFAIRPSVRPVSFLSLWILATRLIRSDRTCLLLVSFPLRYLSLSLDARFNRLDWDHSVWAWSSFCSYWTRLLSLSAADSNSEIGQCE